MITISHIVAAATNGVIGRDGGLPWHIPEDLKFFKEKTLGHAIIMGRKTFESIGRPLPKRLNIIVTRQKNYQPEGTLVFADLIEALAHCQKEVLTWGNEVFIVGGGEIFTQSMELVERIYLTRIHQEIQGDTFYPQPDKTKFIETSRSDREEPLPFSFITLERLPSPRSSKDYLSLC